MSNAVVVPQCTHVKTNGEVCGSPAVSGTGFCYHHSAVKRALAKVQSSGQDPDEGFDPMPFVFPEDRASMQIDFFLLLQAYNEQRIDQRTYNCLLSLLKAMAKNLGKTGRLTEDREEAVSEKAVSDEAASQKPVSDGVASGKAASKADGLESLVNLKASAIAPESCFSKNPKAPASGNDLFRTSTLDIALQGLQPLLSR